MSLLGLNGLHYSQRGHGGSETLSIAQITCSSWLSGLPPSLHGDTPGEAEISVLWWLWSLEPEG